MVYIVADEEVSELEFGFGFSPDRWRMGYQEVCLEGHNYRPLWDLAESLEKNGYRLVDAEETGLTYYSSDGKTEVYIDEVLDTEDEMCRIRILRGELTEDELPEVEGEVSALFDEMTLE